MINHLRPQTQLQNGKYRILRFIKSGGFGCTYEAENTYFEERVAIKEFFVKDFCNRDENTSHISVGTQSKKELVGKLKTKFIAEAKALYKLKHPGIVHVSDVFEENGTAYYVMDYIDGCSLDVYLQQNGPLPEAEALRYIGQVCKALKYVHAQNRLHLDLKPGNIMLAKDSGEAILIDFGSAKQYDECSGENTSTLLGSTPGYAPPEQTNTKITQFFPATDIYSLGATLYKLLTGITPLTANERSSGDELEPLPDTVSEPTRRAIEQALLLPKLKRPQSIDAFLEILDSAPAQAPVPVSAPASAGEDTAIYVKPVSPQIPVVPPPIPVAATMPAPSLVPPPVPPPVPVPSSDTCVWQNSMEWVDLELPSCLLWAKCNLGAEKPEDSGDFYAWGELGVKSKYIESNSEVFGKTLKDISGDASHDVAFVKLHGQGRMPTKEDFLELQERCDWEWVCQNGVNGFKITSRLNTNSIFLPAAGWKEEGYSNDMCGYYWSSTPVKSTPFYAYSLIFADEEANMEWGSRDFGFCIRPVMED